MGITSLWEDLEAKLLTTGQLLGFPWKLWGITVQTSYWEGLWHQNCGYTSPILFFLEAAREISEKWNFFVKRSVPENFQWENFSGQVPTESLRTQDSENVYERWVQQIFDPVLVGRSWVSATKWGLLAKLWGVTKNRRQNFFNISVPKWISTFS